MEIYVNLRERSYKIYIEYNILNGISDIIRDLGIGKRVVIITNPSVNKLYGEEVSSGLKGASFDSYTAEVPDGEEYKTIKEAERLYDELITLKVDRGSAIVALGGGVIGDLAGFVAATYMRGIPYIQIPTSLLAQVDSSVGGKTAVNHPQGKNLIGVFYQPKAVFIDTSTLKTLPREELLAGLAEVVKYGIIADTDLFEYLEKDIKRVLSLDFDALGYIIRTSCRIKGRVVEIDEKEAGYRAVLNFGHTIGHAIETLTQYRDLRHGEAVSIGMVYAARLSEEMGLCKRDEPERIENLLTKIGLPTQLPDLRSDDIITSLYLDKKTRNDKIRFILMKGIGEVKIEEDISPAILRKVFARR
ncbi:MAG: 3-dehydroquinate synthase [Nitrospinae bacterium]|nr:3-dehydroquinate synthase [Nitrospinota bacterium]